MSRLRVPFVLGLLFLAFSSASFASTFSVKTNANDGTNSLRWAVEQANAEEETSIIVFDLSAPEDTITLTEKLIITSSVVVDGSISTGKVTLQGPTLDTLLICTKIPEDKELTLKSINFGKIKKANGLKRELIIFMGETLNNNIAEVNFIDLSYHVGSGNGIFVEIVDSLWNMNIDRCVVENVDYGINLGKRSTITNSIFKNCYISIGGSMYSDYIYVDGCEFYDGYMNVFNARKNEIVNSKFDGSRFGVYVMMSDRDVHIKSCLFQNTTSHAIYSFDGTNNWNIEVEDCEFYNNKDYACFMWRYYSSTFVPEPSKLLFHHNYVGITKDGELRPNSGGVWAEFDYVDIHDNVFSCTEYPAIHDDGNDTIYVRNNYFGTNADGAKLGSEAGAVYSVLLDDENASLYPADRKEYKYYEDNVFYGVKDYGLKSDSSANHVTARRNLFIDMSDPAIIDIQKKQVPEITSFKKDGNNYVIQGTTGIRSEVEIFRSSNAPQSALEYLTMVKPDEYGNFSAIIPTSSFGDNATCISATATYPDRATSNLSNVFCCESCACSPDTTLLSTPDTIQVGETILDSTFTTVGVHDSIFERLKSADGCDSLVMHRVVVKPDPSVLNYYVKTERHGTGDGSSWENAMDGTDFATYLPLAPDGATFYVAEGRYKPIYDFRMNKTSSEEATFFVQSNVIINGGYSKNAKTGAVSDHSQYKTIFSGDVEGNNILRIDTAASFTSSEGYTKYSYYWDEENFDEDVGAIFSLAQSTQGIYYDPNYGGIYPTNSPIQDNGKQKYFNLNGVYLDGGRTGMKSLNPNINITIENTKFANLIVQPTYLTENPATVKVKNSTYEKCGNFEIFGADSIVFSNTKISKSMGCILSTSTADKDAVYIFEDFEYTNNYSELEIEGGTDHASYVSMENCKIENNYDINQIVYIKHGDLVAKNCLFKGNTETPLYVYGRHAHLENCDFVENKMNDDYCIYLYGFPDLENTKPSLSHTTLKNCTFKANEGMYLGQLPIFSSKDSIINCTIEDNKLKEIMFFANDTIVFENTTIKNNEVGYRGIINYSMGLYMNNSLFEGNKVKGIDEDVNTCAIYTQNLHVNNSTIKGNETDSIFFMANHTAEFIDDTVANNNIKQMVYGFAQGLNISRCSFKRNEGELFYCPNTDPDISTKMSIKYTDFTNNNTPDGDLLHLHGKNNDIIDILGTNFNSNSAKYILNIENGNTNISKCDFFNNNVTELSVLSEVMATVEASSFRQNKITTGHLIYSPDGILTLKNNSIVSNELQVGLFSVYPSAAKVYLYNNTITANETPAILLVGGSFTDYAMIGNIIGENLTSGFNEKNILSNVFSKTKNASIPDDVLSKNIFTDDIYSLLYGSLDPATGLFTPTLSYNGGFTPTVALKSDKLPDGTSIRFPLSETTVSTDQRGVERLDMTCMGAYELACSPDTIHIFDTISVGGGYTFDGMDVGSTIAKAGIYDFRQTLKNSGGCDSVVILNLAVRPEANENGYFVKTDGHGDGSNWAEAMSVGRFDTLLPLFPDGTKVFLAEGDYRSTGDNFRLAGRVSITGGFPADATEGAESYPDEHETILSANRSRYGGTVNYYPTSGGYSATGFENSKPCVLDIAAGAEIDIYGITLNGAASCDSGAVNMERATLRLERCNLRQNLSSAIVAGEGSLIDIKDCSFESNIVRGGDGGAIRLSGAKLTASGSIFEMNKAEGGMCSTKGAGGVMSLTDSEVQIENCTFANNSADVGGVFSLSNSTMSLTNNTIAGAIAKENSVFSADAKSGVSLWGNMIVGNTAGYCPADFGNIVSEDNYNIYDADMHDHKGDKDLLMQREEIGLILDGEAEAGHFQPRTLFSGGFTKTIPVLASTFSGGEVLSIEHDAQRVGTDQRGFVRKDTCCIGAFEFPTLMAYHVKKKSVGDGSGRNWDNAMDDTTFARHFPIVPSGAAFYVAGGEYKPFFNNYGRKSQGSDRAYATTRPVSIYGGYSPAATAGAEADPSKYHTVLSADFNGDDVCSPSSENYSMVSITNNKENGIHVISISTRLSGNSVIKGVEIRGQKCMPRGSSAAIEFYTYNVKGGNLTLSQSTIASCYSGIYFSGDTIKVEQSRIDSISDTGISITSTYQIESGLALIDRSSFDYSGSHLNFGMFNGKATVSNSLFTNTNNGISSPAESSSDNTTFDVYNNTFVGGPKAYSSMSISNHIPISIVGNIFSSKDIRLNKYMSKTPVPVNFNYNVYAVEPEHDMGAHDTVVAQSSLSEIMEGEMTDGQYVPAITQTDSIVRSISLVNVNFSEGGGIKDMPKGATPSTTDQTGATRPESIYTRGAREAMCGFNAKDMKLISEKSGLLCRGDSVGMNLEGLSKFELNTYKFAWKADDAEAGLSKTDSVATKIYLRGQKEKVTATLTVTNICSEDTTLTTTFEVGGTGEVPFSGIDESGDFCFAGGEPVELTTEVEGARFRGKCIRDGNLFDPTLTDDDTTTVRCYVADAATGCERYTDRLVHIHRKDESIISKLEILGSSAQTCGRYPDGAIELSINNWRDDLHFRFAGADSAPSMKVTENVDADNALYTAKMESIFAGEYKLYVSDLCYDYDSATVSVEDRFSVKSEDFTIHSALCKGTESGFVRFGFQNNSGSEIEYFFDKTEGERGADTIINIAADTLLFDRLSKGTYLLKVITHAAENCADTFKFEFPISEPEDIFDLTNVSVTDESCGARLAPELKGYAGDKAPIFKWIYEVTGDTIYTGGNDDIVLSARGGGDYTCIVQDSVCGSDTVTAAVGYGGAEPEAFTAEFEAVDELCFGRNNGMVNVVVKTASGKRTPVTVVAENLATGKKLISTYGEGSEDNVIRVENLAPGQYHLIAFSGTLDCIVPTNPEQDTTVTIKAMPNSLRFAGEDSIVDAVCLSNKDAEAHITAYGVFSGQYLDVFQGTGADTTFLFTQKYHTLKGDTAIYKVDSIISGDFTARISGVCDTAYHTFHVGGTLPFKAWVDSSKSKLDVKCPYDSTGVIAARFAGGADSSWCYLYKYDESQASKYRCLASCVVYRSMDSVRISPKELTDYTISRKNDTVSICYGKLVKGDYLIRLMSDVKECEDMVNGFVSISGPADIIHRKEVLRISCTGKHDGQISFQPRRENLVYYYVLNRDSALINMTNGFDFNFVYRSDKSTNWVSPTLTAGTDTFKRKQIFIDEDKEYALITRMNQIYNLNRYKKFKIDGGTKAEDLTVDELNALKKAHPGLFFADINKNFKWYEKDTVNKIWKDITGFIVTAESSDEEETTYFSDKDNNDTIKNAPVWSCSHLEEFWNDHLGKYQDLNTISIGNLRSGMYRVEYSDTVGCSYSDSFDIRKPAKELLIDSVRYDEKGDCDPSLRYIKVYVSGGWGGYNYSIDKLYQEDDFRSFNNYLGGEYVNEEKQAGDKPATGQYRSEFLTPGLYMVGVIDEYGCAEMWKDTIQVGNLNFFATADTVNVRCPRAADASNTVFINDTYKGSYNVYEYISPRENNTDFISPDITKDTVLFKKGVNGYSFDTLYAGGTHGLFIYRTGGDGCGTYLPVVITDTLQPMRIFMDEVQNVSCNANSTPSGSRLNSNGAISLNVVGGTPGYTVYMNERLNKNYDLELKDGVEIRNIITTVVNDKDITMPTGEIEFSNLSPGKYYFTAKDGNGCMRYLGSDDYYTDTVIEIKQPDAINATIHTSAVCPDTIGEEFKLQRDPDTTVLGSIWAEHITGGTPFKGNKYQYFAYKNKEEIEGDKPRIDIPGSAGEENPKLGYLIRDSLGCEFKLDDTAFRDEKILIDRIDFLVSKYGEKGDIYALIDLCEPDKQFEGVTYEFSGENASKFELLDRRMFIFDIENGPQDAKDKLLSVNDTRTEVSDAFFINNFRLRDSLSHIYRHINFVRINDSTESSSRDSFFAKCVVKMKASFAGCQYSTERLLSGSEIRGVNEGFVIYEGGLGNDSDEIISLAVSPNPVSNNAELEITVTLGKRIDFNYYIYSIDGKSIVIDGQSIDNVFVSDSDLEDIGNSEFSYVIKKNIGNITSQVYVVLVTTKHDAETELILTK